MQRILADWDALLPATLAAWGQGDAPLAAAFEAHRSAQMSAQPGRWLALNPLYDGVGEALAECPFPFYIARCLWCGLQAPRMRRQPEEHGPAADPRAPPGIPRCAHPTPLPPCSSKAAHRLVSLLRHTLGMDVEADSPRLFASLIPPNDKKIEALRWVGGQLGGAQLGGVQVVLRALGSQPTSLPPTTPPAHRRAAPAAGR